MPKEDRPGSPEELHSLQEGDKKRPGPGPSFFEHNPYTRIKLTNETPTVAQPNIPPAVAEIQKTFGG